jgi:hypothetical protein
VSARGKTHLVAVAQLPWEEALLLVGRFRAEGIPARVFPETKSAPISEAQFLPIGAAMAGDIGLGRHLFEVFVPKKRAKEAHRIFKEINRTRTIRWK